MSSIESLNLEERLIKVLKKLKVNNIKTILTTTCPVGGLSPDDLAVIQRAAAYKEVLPQPVTGGILCAGVTEISGESSSGKTQFGLQLSLTAQLPQDYGGLDAGTLYICTEDAFPSKRLYQMIENFTSRHGVHICTNGNLGDKIFIEHVADYEGLMSCLSIKAPVLLSSGAVKLIVLDSVAAPFRSDYKIGEMIQRAKDMNTLGSLLYAHSHRFHVPVVCINQVTSSMQGEGSQLVPSLGLSWSNHVTTRLMLSRTDRTISIQQDSAKRPLDTVIREMVVVHAPHLPSMTVPYVIDHEGMKGFT